MTENLKDKAILRNYLLGQIQNEKELDLIEERLLSDEEYLEELGMSESELIDEYVFGKLKGPELENFKRLFLNVPERLEKINFARNLKEYAQDLIGSRRVRTGFFESFGFLPQIAFGLIACILVGGFIIFWVTSQQSSTDVLKGKIASIYKKERPIKGRIVGLEHSPFIVYRGGDSEMDDTLKNQRRQIELEAQEAIRNNPTAENYNLLGVYYLSEKRFDESINHLENSLRINPGNAEARSNLGTAYLEKSKLPNEDKKQNLQKSLDEFNKAFEADKNRIEALFNKALVFQEMNQPQMAIETWKQYLETDKDSEWANEARQNLKNSEK